MLYGCSRIFGKYWECIFYSCDFCISGLTTVQALCCWIFVKSKGLILIDK